MANLLKGTAGTIVMSFRKVEQRRQRVYPSGQVRRGHQKGSGEDD
jgi:hypothetical protein